ncbi:hypothetical protein OG21DRAFT_1507647 [Imleria badia]|nr:hypothetical protein OG21DRAFT_1507647 [Imleria badia]
MVHFVRPGRPRAGELDLPLSLPLRRVVHWAVLVDASHHSRPTPALSLNVSPSCLQAGLRDSVESSGRRMCPQGFLMSCCLCLGGGRRAWWARRVWVSSFGNSSSSWVSVDCGASLAGTCYASHGIASECLALVDVEFDRVSVAVHAFDRRNVGEFLDNDTLVEGLRLRSTMNAQGMCPRDAYPRWYCPCMAVPTRTRYARSSSERGLVPVSCLGLVPQWMWWFTFCRDEEVWTSKLHGAWELAWQVASPTHHKSVSNSSRG